MRSKDVKSTVARTSAVASTTVRDAAEQATQLAKEQAAQAAVLARSAAEKAVPKVGAAVDWASPRIERGLLAAGPKVEAAADKVVPAVDAARDRIVDDLLPRIVEAVTAAAAASATAQRAAADRVSSSLESAATSVVAPSPAPRRGRRLLVFGTIAAAGAAGAAAWRRTRVTGPQWDTLDADGPAFTGGPEPTPRTLTEPTSSASATVAETVTEEPIADAAPEPPEPHGDPLLDALGTGEIDGTDTTGASTLDVPAVEVTEVVVVTGPGDVAVDEASAPTIGESAADTEAGTTSEGSTEGSAGNGRGTSSRRRKA